MSKNRTPIEILQDDLSELAKDGFFNNPSATFLKKIETKINAFLEREYAKIHKNESLFFSQRLRKSYLKHLKELNATHKGLKQYTLNDLKPQLKEVFLLRMNENLGLIKTQNTENMLKMKNRFLNWINLQSVGGNKETLKQATRLTPNKHLKFLLRDQSNKMTAAMDKTIADYYGWIAMQWKTRDDNRVVGKPSGLYPKPIKSPTMHGNHWERKDKFYYKKGLKNSVKKELNLSNFAGVAEFKDGMPGVPIGCRCYAVFYYEAQDLPKFLRKSV